MDTQKSHALLAKGAQIDLHTNNEYTALTFAAEKGHTKIVEALLAKGMNEKIKDHKGGTAGDQTKTQQIKNLPQKSNTTKLVYKKPQDFERRVSRIGKMDAILTYATKKSTKYRDEFEKHLRASAAQYSDSKPGIVGRVLEKYNKAFDLQTTQDTERGTKYSEGTIEITRNILNHQMKSLVRKK